jgi:serine/threonine-protein kinase
MKLEDDLNRGCPLALAFFDGHITHRPPFRLPEIAVAMDLRDRLQSTLGSAYVIERELGGGGMSRVFLAHDTSLGRRIVVKLLPPELAGGVNVERFKREIQLAAQLQHPHIVPLLSASELSVESGDRLPFFTMPFVEGESLRQRIGHGELPITDIVSILRDVARALAHAHARGVIHRDIKPDNVLLTGGSAVVSDFGVAKAVGASTSESGLTSVGVGARHARVHGARAGRRRSQRRSPRRHLRVRRGRVRGAHRTHAVRRPIGRADARCARDRSSATGGRGSADDAASARAARNAVSRETPADRPQSADEVLHALDAVTTPQ